MDPLYSAMLSQNKTVEHAFFGANMSPKFEFEKCHQVHGIDIVRTDLPKQPSANDESLIKADGLISGRADQWIGIQTADCLPILVASRTLPFVAAIHAGWRGVHDGILPVLIEKLNILGIRPQDLTVAIGPAIGSCCFEVGPEVAAAFQSKWNWLWSSGKPPIYQGRKHIASDFDHGNAPRPEAPKKNSDIWIDLRTIAQLQLQNLGVLESTIEQIPVCTYCGTLRLHGQSLRTETNDFSSYRKATHNGVRAGRQWSVIKLVKI